MAVWNKFKNLVLTALGIIVTPVRWASDLGKTQLVKLFPSTVGRTLSITGRCTVGNQTLAFIVMWEPTRCNSLQEGPAIELPTLARKMWLVVACIFYECTNSVSSAPRQFKKISRASQKRFKHGLSMTLRPRWSLYVYRWLYFENVVEPKAKPKTFLPYY